MKTVAVYCDFSELNEKITADFEGWITPHIAEGEKPMKDESVFARVLLKYVLSEFFSVDNFTVALGKNGKPCLSDSKLHFNLSHCLNRVICTVSEAPVGCDVQDIRPFNPRVVSRFYNTDEGMILSASNNKDEHFTKLWVLKESVLKHSGDGITGGLDYYSFPEYLTDDSFYAYGAYFKTLKKDGFIYGVCYETDAITVVEVALKDIIKKMM